MINNPPRTFLGLNGDKNKNIKASRKKGSSYKKKKCTRPASKKILPLMKDILMS